VTARIRPAVPADLAAIVAIKEALAFAPGSRRPRGGFLLGCAPERYSALVAADCVLVLEQDERVAGFAVAVPDPLLRTSDLWARRSLIRWAEREGEPPPGERIAYFDQLALAPSAARLDAAPLALEAARRLAEAGHAWLYATTLQAPIRNPAALPLLRGIGARVVGSVTEYYEEVGEVVSDLHCAPLSSSIAALHSVPLGLRVAARSERLAA
jgi:ribosomal protein S18 acetylase RimI-like enzyme